MRKLHLAYLLAPLLCFACSSDPGKPDLAAPSRPAAPAGEMPALPTGAPDLPIDAQSLRELQSALDRLGELTSEATAMAGQLQQLQQLAEVRKQARAVARELQREAALIAGVPVGPVPVPLPRPGPRGPGPP